MHDIPQHQAPKQPPPPQVPHPGQRIPFYPNPTPEQRCDAVDIPHPWRSHYPDYYSQPHQTISSDPARMHSARLEVMIAHREWAYRRYRRANSANSAISANSTNRPRNMTGMGDYLQHDVIGRLKGKEDDIDIQRREQIALSRTETRGDADELMRWICWMVVAMIAAYMGMKAWLLLSGL